MLIKVLSVLEDAAVILAVAFLFLALALQSLGESAGWSWAGMWCSVGIAVLASGALLRVGPGVIAKMIRAKAAELAKEPKP